MKQQQLKTSIQTHNGKYQCHISACCTYHRPTVCSMLHITLTNCLLLTAKQEPYKTAYLLTKNIEEFFGKSLEERASRQKTIRLKG